MTGAGEVRCCDNGMFGEDHRCQKQNGAPRIIGPDPELVALVREAQRQQAALLSMIERLTSPLIYVEPLHV